MKLFPYGHATHPQWRMAAALALAQVRAQMALPGYAQSPTLGLLYITDHFVDAAADILAYFGAELSVVTDWSGTVGIGIAANNVEYFDEPALAVMLCAVPPDQYRVFSGVAPLGSLATGAFEAHTALVHADAGTPDVVGLIDELAQRTATGYLFGGLASGRGGVVQFAVGGNGNLPGQGAAKGVFSGGLSGVAFAEPVRLLSRVTQGCMPISAVHTITECDGAVVLGLDHQPALDVMMRDLGVSMSQLSAALAAVRQTLVGLSEAHDDAVHPTGQFGADVIVRHIVGLDVARKGMVIADLTSPGMRLTFCRRDMAAARADLLRICAEVREELEPETMSLEVANGFAEHHAQAAPHPGRRMAGAIYVSCTGRGGPHFGGPSAELQIVRRALGDVPLVGFFAGGEIARHKLYGYTGVLTVFVDGSDA